MDGWSVVPDEQESDSRWAKDGVDSDSEGAKKEAPPRRLPLCRSFALTLLACAPVLCTLAVHRNEPVPLPCELPSPVLPTS